MILPYFIFIYFASSVHGIKLHEHMTKREIESTFNCDHKLVHEVEYEVTPILHVDQLNHKGQRIRRSSSAAYFKAFDKDISLYLLENDNTLLGSNTPIFMAQTNRYARSLDGTKKIVYSKMKFPMPTNLKLYHDRKKRAAITVYTDEENKAHMHGVIGDYIVKPIPAHLHKEILPKYPHLYKSSLSYKSSNDSLKNPFFGDSDFGNVHEPTHHIIIKRNVNSVYYNLFGRSWEDWRHYENSEKANSNYLFYNLKNPWNRPMRPTQTQAPFYRYPGTRRPLHLPTDRFPTRFPFIKVPVTQRPTGRRPSKQTPYKPIAHSDIVYPELLVSVDYETYAFHGHDIKELAKYLAAFWNAVDLRFRELNRPQVRLNIAGFIVPQTRGSAPYYEVARVNTETILVGETLRGVQQYFAKQSQFPAQMYDIAVAMTRLSLGSYLPNGMLETTAAGIAYVGQACEVSSGAAATLVQDRGGFDGITNAAHELAHSMGAPHDNEESAKLPMGPCRWSDGYLMSYDTKDSRGMHWSPCSIYAMRQFFRSEKGQCLKTIPPNVGTPYPKILPGKLISRDGQCKASFGLGAVSSKKYENNCAILYCTITKEGELYSVMNHTPPAEGSYCGNGAICLDAQCVRDPGGL